MRLEWYTRWHAMTTNADPISTLFDTLDAWRHFPAYQLERRADIFFSLYLREVVAGERGVELADIVIPELPLKNPDSAQSTKADYFLVSADRSRAFLVELKTDPLSRAPKQDARLEQAARDGIATIIADILQVVIGSSAHTKYLHLVLALEKLGFLNVPTDLEEWVYRVHRRGLSAKLREISVTAQRPSVEVLYVLPQPCERVSCISFETFARYVARHPDPISQRFSHSLHRWREAAGARSTWR